MAPTSDFPNAISVWVDHPSAEGLVVCLQFGMRTKNSYSYVLFLDSEGTAWVSGDALLKVFDEERQVFVMDYDDPRTSFNENITAKVLSTAELESALDAFQMFHGKLCFPEGYEQKVRAAIARGQNPHEYKVELRVSR